jgi:hypothetical protein
MLASLLSEMRVAGRATARTGGARRGRITPAPRRPTPPPRRRFGAWAWLGAEAGALLVVGLVAMVALLGRAADLVGGPGLWSHLLPFAGVTLALGAAATLGVRLWLGLRTRLGAVWRWLPVGGALALAAGAIALTRTTEFDADVAALRRLIGGPAEAHRMTLAHQVYANYRRSDLAGLETILERGRVYEPTVREAAEAFDVDPEILIGIAATESSFHPRRSHDGGEGLFQITAIPAGAEALVQKQLEAPRLDPVNQRHNAFLGAATFRMYLEQMNGDLFLGLLAYNIGPKNGGLRSIMEQYGARDFATIQPYLQLLPRDYPIRVLTAALAYRLWRAGGRLPAYQDGGNAARIQRLGIPGLEAGTTLPGAE